MHARTYGIVARDAPVAVVFRRGPTRHLRLLRWDLAGDTLTAGQWLVGSVNPATCGLSPDGELLVYDYALVDERRRIHEDLGTLDWADWAPDGALLFGRDGCLFHQRGREARLVADLDGQVFERMPPPPEGLQWPAYLRRRGRR